jgi:hypothetical protein
MSRSRHRAVPSQVIEIADGRTRILLGVACYVSREMLTRPLTSVFGERKKPAAMITAIRKPLDKCPATGCYSPSWSHSSLGQLLARVNTIEF